MTAVIFSDFCQCSLDSGLEGNQLWLKGSTAKS
jgi:hypothetical protein